MPIVSELREVIGALQSEVEFEAVVGELGAAGVDRARISYLAQEDIAASCAGAVGCDITQLPRIEISLSDDRQQVRTLATSLAATVASFAGAVLAATLGAAAPAQRILPRAIYLGLGPGSFLIAPMVESLHGASLRAVRLDRAADI